MLRPDHHKMAAGPTQNSLIATHHDVHFTVERESSSSVISQCADECRVFDPSSNREWLELIRDIAAIANSGGGEITVRLVASRPGDAAGASVELASREIID